MCNLHSVTKGQAAIAELARVLRDTIGNMQPYLGVYPDLEAPIVRNAPDRVRELCRARWGMPTRQNVLTDSVSTKTAV